MPRKEENEEKAVPSPGGLFDNGLFIEQVKDCQYVMWDAEGNNIVKQPYVSYGEVYEPIDKPPWPLCKEPVKYDGINELWQEVYSFIFDHLALPNENLYQVLTAWVFSTWTPEIWTVVPYTFFYGPKYSGKTRGLETLKVLSYRGILSCNISLAALFRMCDQWHPTVFLDETEIYNSVNRGEIIGILNAGYKRGQYAYRVNQDKGSILEPFDVFGPKGLAGTRSLRDTLESRCIPIRTIKNLRAVKRSIDEEIAHEIRCKLLMYRMKTLNFKTTKETLDQSIECLLSEKRKEFLSGVQGLDLADGRLYELFQCLVAVSNDGRESILEYAKTMEKARLSEEQTSIEAEIVRILNESNLPISEGVLLTKVLADKFNEERNDSEKWRTSSVGRVMRRLGFQGSHTKKGNGWLLNVNLLQRLAKIYNGKDTPKKGSPPSPPSPNHPLTIHTGEPGEPSEPSPERVFPLTIQETIEKVRPLLTSSFTEDQLENKLISIGFPKENATRFYEYLVDRELIGMDSLGYWHWTLN